jgi:lipid-A-disaccharide synthase-like uncharacterized protein
VIRSTQFWIGLGLLGQALFTARFLLQWIASERRGASVTPTAFWYFSLGGGSLLLTYSIYRRDLVFILGQSVGLVVYLRNLVLIRRAAAAPREEPEISHATVR